MKLFWIKALALIMVSVLASAAPAASPKVRLVSRDLSGHPAGKKSSAPSLSFDGRFVAFQSQSHDLVERRTPPLVNIYLRDMTNGRTSLVSLDSKERVPRKESHFSVDPRISGNGRFIAFSSRAKLSPADPWSDTDVYVRDLRNERTILASVSNREWQIRGRTEAPKISSSGRYVLFQTSRRVEPGENEYEKDVYLRDLENKTTEKISVSTFEVPSNGSSHTGAVSDNGRYVAFQSYAWNLVPKDSNDQLDVYIRDRKKGTTRVISVTNSGQLRDANSYVTGISAGGRFVSMISFGRLHPSDHDGKGDIYIRDRRKDTTKLLSLRSNETALPGHNVSGTISANGRFVLFENVQTDKCFVRDRRKGRTHRIDRGGDKRCHMTDLSDDGRHAGFTSSTRFTRKDDPMSWDVFVSSGYHRN